MDSYTNFLERKSQINNSFGFDPIFMPDFLYDFQQKLVEWSVKIGRGAMFADCGLGKTPMQLVWAENVVRKTGGNILLLTPLAVSIQTIHQAGKFGIEAKRSHDGRAHRGITVTNYEQLHKFNSNDFVGCVCDESSILKSFNGARRKEITQFMRKMKYRLPATATAAPNDYTELGTTSEALGYMGHMDMLNKFFKNQLNNSSTGRYRGDSAKWKFKAHAERHFWRWVCSWARAVRKPSDIGCDDKAFILPPLSEKSHIVESRTLAEGMLFSLPAVGLQEQREERRRTIEERCEMAADLVNKSDQPAMIWCHLNDEGDLLEKLIPGSLQVAGKHSDEVKEERLIGFAQGEFSKLITKPKIGAWGMNYQHCAHMVTFPSHSYEQYYQSVRRCWRFGQKRPVHVDIVTTEGEQDVLKNMQRKARMADRMFDHLVAEMNNALSINKVDKFNLEQGLPTWL